MDEDVIKMQYENGDDVDSPWALESMEPDTYVLILPVESIVVEKEQPKRLKKSEARSKNLNLF